MMANLDTLNHDRPISISFEDLRIPISVSSLVHVFGQAAPAKRSSPPTPAMRHCTPRKPDCRVFYAHRRNSLDADVP
jgi:hypothetical protein